MDRDELKIGLVFMAVILFMLLAPLAGILYGNSKEAEIINERYGTNYTASDMFWAGETIKQNIEGIRIRMENEKLPPHTHSFEGG